MANDDITSETVPTRRSSSTAQKIFKWLRVYLVPALGLICTGAGIGIGCFIRLSSHKVLMSDTVILLFSLPGEVLMRMLKVIILPLVVSSTFSASSRLPGTLLGKMSIKILLFYLTTSLLAAIVGVISVFIFQPNTWDLLHVKTKDYVENDNYWLSILLDFIRNLLPDNLVRAFYQHTQTVLATSEFISYHYDDVTTTTESYSTLTYNDSEINSTDLSLIDYDLFNLTMSLANDSTSTISTESTEYSAKLLDDVITENPFALFEADYLRSDTNWTNYNDTSNDNLTVVNVANLTTTSEPIIPPKKRRIVKDVVEKTEWISVYRNGPSLLGLIGIHAAFGIASRNVNNKLVVLVESFCTALHLIMIKMSQAIMWYFPIGVFFLTLSDVMSTGEVYPFSKEMARFAASMASAMVLHGFVTLSLLYWFLIRKNPFIFWKHNWAPFLVVFGTKSRVTSLPFNMKCMEDKSAVDQRITRLFLPLGSALNSDGDAIYSAVSTLFLVQLSGVELNLEHYLYVCFTSSTLHTKGIVYMHQLLIVQMSTRQLAVLTSVDWIGGRLRETVNVISDAVAVSVMQHYSAEELRLSDPGKYNLDKLNNRFIPKTYSRASTDSDSNGECCERYTDV